MIFDAIDPCSIPPFTDLSLLSFHIPYHIGKAFNFYFLKIKEIIEYWKMTLLSVMVRVSCRGGIQLITVIKIIIYTQYVIVAYTVL